MNRKTRQLIPVKRKIHPVTGRRQSRPVADSENIFDPFYRVITATNGKEGLSATFEHKPDIIISDIMMPEMNGTEMCLKIKSNIDLCHIPVILLTALNSTEQNIEGLNRGADDYITKPFDTQILLARTNNLVRNRLLIQHQLKKQPISEVDLASINPLDQQFLQKVDEVIEQHIDDVEFDIPKLCQEVGMGRSLLYSKFKALTGMTPNNFLLNYRLKYAATLLQNIRLSLLQKSATGVDSAHHSISAAASRINTEKLPRTTDGNSRKTVESFWMLQEAYRPVRSHIAR